MKALKTLTTFICFSTLIFGQAKIIAPDGGGEYKFGHTECISNVEREIVNAQIEENIIKYKIPRTVNKSVIVLFDWPVLQNPTFDYNSTYAISNYVDQDPAWPNQLQDYNCGMHTYDTPTGYNHQGIDIFLWPFDHNQVSADQTWAVAAADGTILNKQDGNVDNNCAFNANPANYVIIEHSDNSRSWYWHLKQNSVTSKAIGSSVVAGEYLGVVASSGNSTGPHLHFECYDDNLDLIDPYAGTCNDLNASTYWNNQKPYFEPTINAILVHDALPQFNSCPNLDVINEAPFLNSGQLGYFIAYYHDQQNTSTSFYVIKRPNGTTYTSWNHTPSISYRASWWYWSYFIPGAGPSGTWTFEVTLNGNTVVKDFEVDPTSCPPSYTAANGNPLIGTQNTSDDFETDGSIESTQVIQGATTIVDYDSGTMICLDSGFEIKVGAEFHAFIDGCGGAMAKDDNVVPSKN